MVPPIADEEDGPMAPTSTPKVTQNVRFFIS